MDEMTLEHIQAWLRHHCELLRMRAQQAMLIAGRFFRLQQMASLSDICLHRCRGGLRVLSILKRHAEGGRRMFDLP